MVLPGGAIRRKARNIPRREMTLATGNRLDPGEERCTRTGSRRTLHGNDVGCGESGECLQIQCVSGEWTLNDNRPSPLNERKAEFRHQGEIKRGGRMSLRPCCIAIGDPA